MGPGDKVILISADADLGSATRGSRREPRALHQASLFARGDRRGRGKTRRREGGRALQAGRDPRHGNSEPTEVDDDAAALLSHEIARQMESLELPGAGGGGGVQRAGGGDRWDAISKQSRRTRGWGEARSLRVRRSWGATATTSSRARGRGAAQYQYGDVRLRSAAVTDLLGDPLHQLTPLSGSSLLATAGRARLC